MLLLVIMYMRYMRLLSLMHNILQSLYHSVVWGLLLFVVCSSLRKLQRIPAAIKKIHIQ